MRIRISNEVAALLAIAIASLAWIGLPRLALLIALSLTLGVSGFWIWALVRR